ncbi:hypothetical protein ACVRY7_04760 [Streptococcus ictaluri]|uniref:Periplasmic binding protein and sugar binding domain of the LacI family protein n=1 Tax=Streptococcus ictaluri 707-05 TaxID=764299 RepID=G5K1J9_9STRE|nr:periplasmic binding protein and sugar binding domain of the LacI family protein [Streptococcus ictaluri]EHI70205.1 periplasmic binding protein and sugar binding domain of the LacI family protein [Streptococcus ictaluri 707-05]
MEQDYLEQLKGKAFDSLIFSSRKIPVSIIENYAKYGQIVLLEPSKSPLLSSISVDRSQGLMALCQWLKKQDIKKCALLFSRKKETSVTYKATMKAFHNVFGKQQAFETYGNISTYQDAYDLAKLLEKDSEIGAIIANGDDVAAGLLTYYQEKGLRLPLIVSQESQLSGKLLKIPSVNNHSFELGKTAFQLATQVTCQHQSLDSDFLLR